MAAELLPYLNRATDSDGNPLSGAKFYFYATGTTTPQDVYTTDELNVAHANPVVADSAGLFDEIYFDASLTYRGVLKTADEATTIIDVDPINANVLSQLALSSGSASIGYIDGGANAVARTVQAKNREIPSILDFIPVAEHAAILAYTSTTDLATYIANAYAAHSILYWPAGRYYTESTIDLDAIYGAGIIGEGSNVSNKRTEIVINATNTQGVALWGPARVQDVYIRYAAQQTTANTSSILLACNNITTAHFQNVRLRYGHINLGIPQVDFDSTGYNTIFASHFDGIYSYEASHTHLDLRCFNGGGTNVLLNNIYINGGGSLDFATAGQSCEYAIRGASWSGYEVAAVSIDGQIFNQRMVELNQCFATFDTLRFEAATTTKDNDAWIYATGSESVVSFGYVEFKNCRIRTEESIAFGYLFRDAATIQILDVGTLRVTSDCEFTATSFTRILTTSTTSVESRIRFWNIDNAASGLNDDAFTDPGSPADPSCIKVWHGKPLSITWKNLDTTQEFDWRYGSAAPAAGTWVAGDFVINTAPTANGILGWSCTTAGTPGTWSPIRIPVQGAAIADASGGAIIDAEARTALNSLLATLRTQGTIAT